MDLRVEYKNSTREQAQDLFTRFFSQDLMVKSVEAAAKTQAAKDASKPKQEISEAAIALFKRTDNTSFISTVPTIEEIDELATSFGEKVPENKYSIAQLQGYLLCNKRDPRNAVKLFDEWLDAKLKEEGDKERRLEKRKAERQKWLKLEKFRQERDKKMQEEMEKELEAEAEAAEKAKKALEEEEAAASKDVEKTEGDSVESAESSKKEGDGAAEVAEAETQNTELYLSSFSLLIHTAWGNPSRVSPYPAS